MLRVGEGEGEGEGVGVRVGSYRHSKAVESQTHPVLTGTGCRGGALTGEPPDRVGGRKCPGLAFEEPAEHKDYPRKKSNVMLVLCADMLAVVAHWTFCGFSPLNFFQNIF